MCYKKDKEKNIYIWKTRSLSPAFGQKFSALMSWDSLSEKMPGLKKRLEKISGMIPNFLNLLFPSRIFQETGDLTQYVLRVGNTVGDAILGRKNKYEKS